MITIKGLVDEDFIQYKKPSMFIIFPFCNFKCDKEAGCAICQNSALAHEPKFDMPIIDIIKRYIDNPITKALVFGGLEPFDNRGQLFWFIRELREYIQDDIVIYTGYTEDELQEEIQIYKQFPNIIIKFGRFIPNQEKHYDEVLGVELASPNQYARRIS